MTTPTKPSLPPAIAAALQRACKEKLSGHVVITYIDGIPTSILVTTTENLVAGRVPRRIELR